MLGMFVASITNKTIFNFLYFIAIFNDLWYKYIIRDMPYFPKIL